MKNNNFSQFTILVIIATCSISCRHSKIQENNFSARMPSDTGIIAESLPPVEETLEQQNKIWQKYCVGARLSTDIPFPNYTDKDVRSAAGQLAMVFSQSFYFYSGPLYAYGLKKDKVLIEPPTNFPNVPEVFNGKKNAHVFLTLLCGEFRDRPTLIREKIQWVNKINKLKAEPQPAMKVNDNVWEKMTAESYSNYINNSMSIYRLKKQFQMQEESKIGGQFQLSKMGKYEEASPVEPYTVCETKYIFQRYVIPKKNIEFSTSYESYMTDYNKFAKSKCTQIDLDYFYDFRGDSNFKPNSPESNAMIWYSSTIANNCVRKDGKLILKATATGKISNPTICEDYFKAPFAHRWSAARAGLAAWIHNSKALDDIFSDSDETVTVIPNYSKLNDLFDFKTNLNVDDKIHLDWKNNKTSFWQRSDLGFNQITNLGLSSVNKEKAFEKLRNSVNRHTDWYNSGYNDLVGAEKTEAYSPFVASSYEMNASNGFTSPGMTVQSPADGCKHWMFVFKIKKDQWYSTQSIVENKPVDFNKNWFDETSLGTNALADSERALDRLGTTLEGEMDSILYLNNITTGGVVKNNCGQGFINK
jgi:hypothetical protein